MATTRSDSYSLRLFKRTDILATHVIIFAHGRTNRATFPVPLGKTIHHYIDDNNPFNLRPASFDDAFQGRLDPVDTFGAGENALDYTLTKAAGTHIAAVALRQSYDNLDGHVNRSGLAANAVLPRSASQLGAGVTCDIASVRNRNVNTANSLRTVVNNQLLAPYVVFHCFFCRIGPGGNRVGQAPRRFPGL